MFIVYAITSYFFTALTNVADKVLLKKVLPSPAVYAFLIGLMGCVVIIAAPFGVTIISGTQLFISLLSGMLFVLGLLLMFTGYQGYPATVVATLVGGFQPMMTLVLARVFLGEILPSQALFAVTVLLAALGCIAYVPGQKFDSKLILITLLSGLGFASSFVLVKLLYSHVSFLDGIFWSRLGAGVAAVSLLLLPKFRHSILGFFSQKQEKNQSGLLIVGIQLLGALGFILYNFAISQGSVTIVNAMQGIQFAFIFIISYFLSYRFDALKEKLSTQLVTLRIIGLVLIAYGLYLLSHYV